MYLYDCVNRVIGSVIIVIGLYSVLWGKYKEEKEKKLLEEIPETIKNNSESVVAKDKNEANGNINSELQKGDHYCGDTKCHSLVINIPHSTRVAST